MEMEQVAPATLVEARSEEHTSELQSRLHLVCRLLLEKKKTLVCRKRIIWVCGVDCRPLGRKRHRLRCAAVVSERTQTLIPRRRGCAQHIACQGAALRL